MGDGYGRSLKAALDIKELRDESPNAILRVSTKLGVSGACSKTHLTPLDNATSQMNALKTLPAPVPPAQGFYKKAKALLGFYKTGLYNVWGNHKTCTQLCKTYNAKSPSELIGEYYNYRHLQDIKKGKSVFMQDITREDLLTLARTPSDFVKIPGFALTLLVFFEMTPIILFLFPRCSPSTCYSESFRKKLDTHYEANRVAYAALKQGGINESTSVHGLSRGQLVGISKTLLTGSPWIYSLAPSSWLKKVLLQHTHFVKADDYFLRSSGLNELVDAEIERACRDRGLQITGNREQQQKALEKWAESFKEPADIGYFVQ